MSVKIIESFILDKKVQDILYSINNRVMDFNVLEITGMGTQELKHSNILSWMFGDNEHNLGNQIFKNFIYNLSEYNESEELKRYIYLYNQNKNLKVYREYKDIDLLIIDDANEVVFAIENKLYSTERRHGIDGGQLKKYKNIVNEEYPNFDKYYIYLTIDGIEASVPNWYIANYKMITDSIEEIIKNELLTDNSQLLLTSYVDLLKRRDIVPDKAIKELCERIWSNPDYRQAIDIINQYRVYMTDIIYEKVVTILEQKYSLIVVGGTYIESENIKNLYTLFRLAEWDKSWDNQETSVIDIFIEKGAGYIWVGYYHPHLREIEASNLQEVYESIVGHSKMYNQNVIVRYDEDSIQDANDIDLITEKITDAIYEADLKIGEAIKPYIINFEKT